MIPVGPFFLRTQNFLHYNDIVTNPTLWHKLKLTWVGEMAKSKIPFNLSTVTVVINLYIYYVTEPDRPELHSKLRMLHLRYKSQKGLIQLI